MKKFLLATTALAMSGIAASAADLPSRKGPPIAPAYIPAFTWTGFYVGLNAGGGVGEQRQLAAGGRDSGYRICDEQQQPRRLHWRRPAGLQLPVWRGARRRRRWRGRYPVR